MAVSKRTRYEVLRRDNHTCRYCGGSAPDVVLTVDHVTPVALGGTDDPSNLVAACKDCNAGKTSTSPDAAMVEDVRQVDLKWAGALRRVAASRARQRKKAQRYVAEFDRNWCTWRDRYDNIIYRPGGWETSIHRFYELGVSIDDLNHCADVACGNQKIAKSDAFRYFAGCVWRVVTEMQQAAKALLEQEQPPSSQDEEDWSDPSYNYAAGWWAGWFNAQRVAKRIDPVSAVVDQISFTHMPTSDRFGIQYWNGVPPMDEYDKERGIA